MCNCRGCFILVLALEIQCERDRMRRFVERWNNEAELLSPERSSLSFFLLRRKNIWMEIMW